MSLILFTRHQEKDAPKCSVRPNGMPYFFAACFHRPQMSFFGPTRMAFMRLIWEG